MSKDQVRLEIAQAAFERQYSRFKRAFTRLEKLRQRCIRLTRKVEGSK